MALNDFELEKLIIRCIYFILQFFAHSIRKSRLDDHWEQPRSNRVDD